MPGFYGFWELMWKRILKSIWKLAPLQMLRRLRFRCVWMYCDLRYRGHSLLPFLAVSGFFFKKIMSPYTTIRWLQKIFILLLPTGMANKKNKRATCNGLLLPNDHLLQHKIIFLSYPVSSGIRVGSTRLFHSTLPNPPSILQPPTPHAFDIRQSHDPQHSLFRWSKGTPSSFFISVKPGWILLS